MSLQEWNLIRPARVHRPRQLPRAVGRRGLPPGPAQHALLPRRLPAARHRRRPRPGPAREHARSGASPCSGRSTSCRSSPAGSSWRCCGEWLLNPSDGIVNWLLGLVGIDGPGWWTSRTWAMPSVILASAWKDLGFVMVILLAGLQAIPPRRSTRRRCSTAPGRGRQLRRITIPLLTPSLFFVIVISLINGFQVFDQVLGDDRGRPGRRRRPWSSSRSCKNTFTYGRAGYASAQSVVLFVIILADHRGPAPAAEAVGALCVSSRTRRRRLAIVGRYAVLGARAPRALLIGPFVWMVLASLKTDADIRRLPPTLLPDPVTGENYQRVIDAFPFWRFAAQQRRSSSIASTVLQLVTASTAAYAFARIEFRGRNVLFGLYLATMMIPLQVIIVPLFIEMRNLDLVDTLRRADPAHDRVELRGVPAPPGVPRAAPRARRGRVHRRRRPLPRVRPGPAAAHRAGPRDVRGVRVHGHAGTRSSGRSSSPQASDRHVTLPVGLVPPATAASRPTGTW